MRVCNAKKILCLLLSLCAFLLASCGEQAPVTGSPPQSVTLSSAETAEKPVSETKVSDGAETVRTSENPQTQSEKGDTIGAEAPDTPDLTDVTERTETSETSETASVTETEASSAETSAPASSQTETTAAEMSSETAASNAEVVIPEVKTPLASGTSVLTGENAEVDYGNASDGYISAVYSGGSAMAKLRVKRGDVQYDHDLAAGGKREFFPLMGSGSYTVKIYEQVSGKNYAEVLSGDFDANVKSETGAYLYPNKYVNFGNGSVCVEKAAEVCAGKSGDVEKIAAVFDYIADSIAYDKQLAATVKSGYIPDPDRTIAAGKGICFDYASLFAAMCRSQGIPSRLVIGYAEPNIYHAWNEVYTEETGWITPELFLKQKGYNIADATFYAGNTDKKKIAEYISDDGNYSAMYRY